MKTLKQKIATLIKEQDVSFESETQSLDFIFSESLQKFGLIFNSKLIKTSKGFDAIFNTGSWLIEKNDLKNDLI
jgi:hypothetical protein